MRCTFRKDLVSKGWERPTSMVLSGHSNATTVMFSRWMPTSPTIPSSCLSSIKLAPMGADMSVGSRYIKGGGVENWAWHRRVLSRYASVYVRMVLWISVKDTTAGFKCYTRRVLQAIDFDSIKFVGYAFQIEMKYTAIKLGFRIAEVPILFVDRKEGVSKMSMGIFREAFIGVWKMRFRKISKKNAA